MEDIGKFVNGHKSSINWQPLENMGFITAFGVWCAVLDICIDRYSNKIYVIRGYLAPEGTYGIAGSVHATPSIAFSSDISYIQDCFHCNRQVSLVCNKCKCVTRRLQHRYINKSNTPTCSRVTEKRHFLVAGYFSAFYVFRPLAR